MTNSDIIACSALIVAVVSVLIAMRQLDIQQNHNKKSLKPIGYIDVGDYEENLYAKISNHGLGPMIIIKAEFKNSQKTLSNIVDFLPDGFIYDDFVKEFQNKIITPNNYLYLFNALFEEGNFEDKDKFRAILKDITVIFHYKSVYGEDDSCSRKLDWFGRKLA